MALVERGHHRIERHVGPAHAHRAAAISAHVRRARRRASIRTARSGGRSCLVGCGDALTRTLFCHGASDDSDYNARSTAFVNWIWPPTRDELRTPPTGKMVALRRRRFNIPNAASGRRRMHLSVRSTILIVLTTVTAVVVLGVAQQNPPHRRTKRMSVEWRTTGEARMVTGVLLDSSGEPLNDR